MYKPGGTIADALQRIEKGDYVLPAIQREFVWKPEQIERLFDSLMQGYPFGTFLFWKVEPQTSSAFKFYDFVLNYHERDAAHCPELATIYNRPVTAVLDGQQRLTALNVGLRGTMAVKAPGKWWNNDSAFPKKKLRLNLLAPRDADENGQVFEFQFLSKNQAEKNDTHLWFPVPKILGMKGGPPMVAWLTKQGLEGDRLNTAYETLDRLHQVVNTEQNVFFYEEESQDIERVLNIFIRLNSGGTVLSYSDLLLSIAVAQWKKIDARAEIHSLVDEINRLGTGFALSKDFVLKAGLMLADIASVGFKVENFTQANMERLEENWSEIRTALVRTVELAASFGLNGQTLRADSALLPIAYFLFHSKAPSNFVESSQFSEDREAIRFWLTRSLLKASGIWGSGLDTLLTALRDIIKSSDGPSFPDAALERVMEGRGKSLRFSSEEIDDMLDMQYGDKRMFALLSLLFPFVNLRNQFHMDHVFPISRFTKAKLRKTEIPEEQFEELREKANGLPNLQLLEGSANIEKRDAPPYDWLDKQFQSDASRENYCQLHELGSVPGKIEEFADFHAERRTRLRGKIHSILKVNQDG